jgi:hypothetical protein
MYWPFGRHILAAAKFIRNQPKLYAIYLTYHGCGPDGMIAHLFESEMSGKPYLSIEVDEHSSDVGVITRLEAFVNSVRSTHVAHAGNVTIPSAPVTLRGLSDRISALSKESTIAIPYLYPFSAILAAYLRGRGYTVHELPGTTADTLEEGRLRTYGKEYFTFAALLGDVITYAKNHPSSQLLLAQTDGAETDGQYSRVIKVKLDALGLGSGIVAPVIEDLPEDSSACDVLFRVLLAGDILLCLPTDKQTNLLAKILKEFADGIPSDETLVVWAESYADNDSQASGKSILLIGEPGCLFNRLFWDEMTLILDRTPHIFRFAPLCETLLFQWADRPGYDTAHLIEMERTMQQVSAALGGCSPFSDSISALREKADKTIGIYIGGMGRYRGAKMMSALPNAVGILAASSLYENTAAVLELLIHTTPLPVLTIGFNGSLGSSDRLRLSSFARHLEV